MEKISWEDRTGKENPETGNDLNKTQSSNNPYFAQDRRSAQLARSFFLAPQH
jgi:hypothetical protein